jgi:predicted MFS family arabinose efflux permease
MLQTSNVRGVVVALGTEQTIAFGSTYYLPAVLATPIARDLGLPTPWVFAAFSLALLISAAVGPWGGRRIDRLGGRGVLAASNLVFATGLALLGCAQGPAMLFAAWAIIGLGMGIGLYESAFATLAAIYGREARSPIIGITLIAGFASTVGWPLSGLMEAQIGWRSACFGWAAIHLLIALPLNVILPPGGQSAPAASTPANPETEADTKPPFGSLLILAIVFATTWFTSTAMAAHLPRLLEAAGASTAAAIAAGALIGPAQVAARIADYGLLRRFHPLVSARIASLGHPVGAALLMLIGGPAASVFALLHGAGNGVMTIAKGTLPLALFGASGYGHRLGLLNAPARALQALAPLLFGYAIDSLGAGAIWITAALGVGSLGLLFLLRVQPNARATEARDQST